MIHVDRNRAVDGKTIKPSKKWFEKAKQLKNIAIKE